MAGDESNGPQLSVVLNVMGRVELAECGFRSWMLQERSGPYEVVLNLFNNEQPRFEALAEGRNPECRLVIHTYDRPPFFNISAANNLGLHHATGRYVLFANADMIYPSDRARLLVQEVAERNLGFAMAARVDLREEQAKALKPAREHTTENNFDFLLGIERTEGMDVWGSGQGWILRRDVARAIGGFDPRIRCGEDVDITDRAMHYLRRTGTQSAIHFMQDLWAYHVYHPTTELFDTYAAAMEICRERRDRMFADPNGTMDVVPTPLDSHDALRDAALNSPKPPTFARYRQNTVKKIGHRLNRAFNVLIGRR